MDTLGQGTALGHAGVLWSDDRLLGYGPMDETHREFYEVVFRLLTCQADTALDTLAGVTRHAREHFEQENGWMQSTGFPSGQCHIDEHDAVLRSLTEVEQALREGRANETLAHQLAEHLLAWFPGHADYMDSALAAWMSKRQYGGKPVVIKRHLADTLP